MKLEFTERHHAEEIFNRLVISQYRLGWPNNSPESYVTIEEAVEPSSGRVRWMIKCENYVMDKCGLWNFKPKEVPKFDTVKDACSALAKNNTTWDIMAGNIPAPSKFKLNLMAKCEPITVVAVLMIVALLILWAMLLIVINVIQ
jgi:hypothetical protein